MKTHKIKGKDYSEETIQNALEAYIKAEPEPEYVPEHLDYGLDERGNIRVALAKAGKNQAATLAGAACIGLCSGGIKTKMGNLGADLKQWATDCEEGTFMHFPVNIRGDGNIHIDGRWYEPENAIKLANLIKQVAYTQLRKRPPKVKGEL